MSENKSVTFSTADTFTRAFVAGALYNQSADQVRFSVKIHDWYVTCTWEDEDYSPNIAEEISEVIDQCTDYLTQSQSRSSKSIAPPTPTNWLVRKAIKEPFDKMSRRVAEREKELQEAYPAGPEKDKCSACKDKQKLIEEVPCLACQGGGEFFRYPKGHETGRL